MEEADQGSTEPRAVEGHRASRGEGDHAGVIRRVVYGEDSCSPLFTVQAEDGLYLGGFLTAAGRDEWVARWGWEVVG